MAALPFLVRQVVFPRAHDATSTPAFPQSIRGEDVNCPSELSSGLLETYRIAAAWPPALMPSASHTFLRYVPFRTSTCWWAVLLSYLSLVCGSFVHCARHIRVLFCHPKVCRQRAYSVFESSSKRMFSSPRRHHEPWGAVPKVAVKTTPSIGEETPKLIPSPADVPGVPSTRSSAEPSLGEASARQVNFRWLVEHNSLRASLGATVVAKYCVEQ